MVDTLHETDAGWFLLQGSAFLCDEGEQRIIHGGGKAKAELKPVISRQEVLELRELADRVWVDPAVERYMVEIVAATRNSPKITLGSSSRGSIALNAAAKAMALSRGRSYVVADDVKYLVPFVLGHRVTLSHEAKTERLEAQTVVKELAEQVLAPV